MQSDSINTRAARAGTIPASQARPARTGGFHHVLAHATDQVSAPAARPHRASQRAHHLAAITALPLTLQAASPDAFRDRIALAEGSRERYAIRNLTSGALGRYQFMPQTLHDLGWKDAAGNWTALAARHGVSSDEQFLASPAAQEAAMTNYLARTEQQLSRNGSLAQAGGSVRGLDGQEVPLTEAGLVAAAHRRGAGSVARYLAHRANTPDAALSPQQRRAFASVERRLREFSEMPYSMAGRRGATSPSA
jgi:hypothetical protein